MHEISVALGIVDAVAQQATQSRIEKVTAVHVRIGALTAVDASALTFAWELATSGTPADGSRLVIEHVPLAIACAPCAGERTIEKGTLPVCPVCGTTSTSIVRGRDLQITAMEVVHDASTGGSRAEHSAQKQHAGRGSS